MATGTRRRAVFLDRDGVLNRGFVHEGHPRPPASLAELVIMPGAAAALATLRGRGFLLVGVTNQPDVARGTQRREVVETINAALRRELPLDDLRVCYHDDADGCDCRKPKPGLLLAAAAAFGIDLSASFMIGDRWRDIEAGRRAGCTTVLIAAGDDPHAAGCVPDYRASSIATAASWVLARAATSAVAVDPS
jgi:D-glycero-D-manno-heptose 1,7-bisphosphate phosphatase